MKPHKAMLRIVRAVVMTEESRARERDAREIFGPAIKRIELQKTCLDGSAEKRLTFSRIDTLKLFARVASNRHVFTMHSMLDRCCVQPSLFFSFARGELDHAEF